MNERIKALWENNNDIHVRYPEQGSPVSVSAETLEKFAKLIVRECMEIAYEYDAPKMSGPGMIIGNRIQAHFEVGMTTEDKKTLIKELLGVKND